MQRKMRYNPDRIERNHAIGMMMQSAVKPERLFRLLGACSSGLSNSFCVCISIVVSGKTRSSYTFYE